MVGSRPVFQVTYSGIEEEKLRDMRFRIALSTDRFRSEVHVFDQRARRSGWAAGQDGHAVYLPRMPIPDGNYEWRAWYWNGVEWVGGESTFRLRIDTVPPAEIEDLVLGCDRGTREVLLSWKPVGLDRDGGPEFVARYRLYRYAGPLPFARIPAHEIAVTESERLTLGSGEVEVEGATLIYFAVSAEDEAGNRAGDPRHERREPAFGPEGSGAE